MTALNKLHSMFESENLRRDFTLVQMEQMVSRDVRDNTLTCLEHMQLDDDALEASMKNDVEDKSDNDVNKDKDSDFDDDIEDTEEGITDLELEIESLEQSMMDAAENDTTTKGPLYGMTGTTEKADPALEEVLRTIPEATPEEVTEFFRATEEDGSFEQNTALESEMAVINMLIPDTM